MGRRHKRQKKRTDTYKEAWEPRPGRKDRPTPERLLRGHWGLLDTEDAGTKHAKDFQAHPIDSLEHRGVISNEQASAGRDYEALYRAANGGGGIRDSTTLFEPKGHDNDDGNIPASRDRHELYLFLGVYRDRLLRRTCVDHLEPKVGEIGLLREALNECCRFFK
ncbi:MAG: hypothetical protein AAF562_06710 [Pseudomonadota bacterium]